MGMANERRGFNRLLYFGTSGRLCQRTSGGGARFDRCWLFLWRAEEES